MMRRPLHLSAFLVLAACTSNVLPPEPGTGGAADGGVPSADSPCAGARCGAPEAADAAVAPAAPVSPEAGAPTSFADSYSGASDDGGDCTTTYRIAGKEPGTPGKHPLFVYVMGTYEIYDSPVAAAVLDAAAARGLVAASLEYGNGKLGRCSASLEKTACMFNPTKAGGAIAKLCARPTVDCTKGVVVAGFSQGSVVAVISANYNPRIEAVYAMGTTSRFSTGQDLSACMIDGKHALPSARLRAVNGEYDQFAGVYPSGVRREVELVTGKTCGATANDCLGADGSGSIVVQGAQVQDGYADHCYMRMGGCSNATDPADATWSTGTESWQLAANLDWLKTFVTP